MNSELELVDISFNSNLNAVMRETAVVSLVTRLIGEFEGTNIMSHNAHLLLV